jgi:hypothetical protein
MRSASGVLAGADCGADWAARPAEESKTRADERMKDGRKKVMDEVYDISR